MKKCPRCRTIKSNNNFHKDKGKKDGLRTYCTLCVKELANKEKLKEYGHHYYIKNKEKIDSMQKERNINNPKTRQIINRSSRLKYKYNITIDEYNALFTEQGGSCAICGTHQSALNIPLCVDHSHLTGKIRGLLCRRCNTGIGLLKDSKDILYRAAKYLEDSG